MAVGGKVTSGSGSSSQSASITIGGDGGGGGILAQSIGGGGGGDAGAGIGGDVVNSGDKSFDFSLGAKGGTGRALVPFHSLSATWARTVASAGQLRLPIRKRSPRDPALSYHPATLTTNGDGSHALLAQSIGDGGGVAGDGAGLSTESTEAMVNVGGVGTSGSGGPVVLQTAQGDAISGGAYITKGVASIGILAQSMGGCTAAN